MRLPKPAVITYQSLFLLIALTAFSCKSAKKEMPLRQGMYINSSVSIQPGTYFLPGADSLNNPVITIEGNDIVLDFNGAILMGAQNGEEPDQFKGLGIYIKGGKNIQIKNAIVKGYKVGLMASGVDSLQLLGGDFSYNYRPRLKSNPEWETLSDWLSYHHNEKDEWLRYGAAIYLKDCQRALVKDLTVNRVQNALLLVNCNNGLFYNNNFSYNSGLGLGMYRSGNNRVMHNRMDWCIRGYSHGIYNRGQDSAGILAYEQSSDNTFAYNSATHSGDGFFLWAGQSTMDSGQGGCNNNLIYNNDFSHASNNGVEITFSSNQVVGNRLEDCDYGVWGGYSYHTTIAGNNFKDNNHDVAFEHGHHNTIRGNRMEAGKVGIQLWERSRQPREWGFAQNRNIQSSAYEIDNNLFIQTKAPLKIEQSKNVSIHANQFFQFQQLLNNTSSNDSLFFYENTIYQNDLLEGAYPFREKNKIENGGKYEEINLEKFTQAYKVEPLADGHSTALPASSLRGRQYMLITEWGPYNFAYPSIWLRNCDETSCTFALFGPAGNWKIVGGKGFTSFSRKTGAMPATVVAAKAADFEGQRSIQLEFIGSAFEDELGNTHEKGRPYPFNYEQPKE